VKKYREKHGQVPDALGTLAYDGTNLPPRADPEGGKRRPRKIRDALASIKGFPRSHRENPRSTGNGDRVKSAAIVNDRADARPSLDVGPLRDTIRTALLADGHLSIDGRLGIAQLGRALGARRDRGERRGSAMRVTLTGTLGGLLLAWVASHSRRGKRLFERRRDSQGHYNSSEALDPGRHSGCTRGATGPTENQAQRPSATSVTFSSRTSRVRDIGDRQCPATMSMRSTCCP